MIFNIVLEWFKIIRIKSEHVQDERVIEENLPRPVEQSQWWVHLAHRARWRGTVSITHASRCFRSEHFLRRRCSSDANFRRLRRYGCEGDWSGSKTIWPRFGSLKHRDKMLQQFYTRPTVLTLQTHALYLCNCVFRIVLSYWTLLLKTLLTWTKPSRKFWWYRTVLVNRSSRVIRSPQTIRLDFGPKTEQGHVCSGHLRTGQNQNINLG